MSMSMLQIAVWGLAGVVAVLSTLPVFIVRSGGASVGGRGWAFAVLAFGVGFSAFLFLAAAEQAGGISGSSYEPSPISPNDLNNPFSSQ